MVPLRVEEDPVVLNRPAYDVVQQILTEPLRRFAERVDVVQQDAAFAVRYSVDGFPYASVRLNRNQNEAAVSYVKNLAGMNDVESLNKAWDGPDTLPTMAELADPDTWISRVLTGGS